MLPIRDLPTPAGAWQIVGFFGSCEWSEIPKVLTAAVLDPTEEFVVASDIAGNDTELREQEQMPREAFDECVAFGSATPLPPCLWEPEAVLLLVGGALDLVSLWEAEVCMNQFVQARRRDGQAALARGDRAAALDAFDLARRVSSEREDIEQVVALAPDPRVRGFFAQAFTRVG